MSRPVPPPAIAGVCEQAACMVAFVAGQLMGIACRPDLLGVSTGPEGRMLRDELNEIAAQLVALALEVYGTTGEERE